VQHLALQQCVCAIIATNVSKHLRLHAAADSRVARHLISCT
jgi:hypothetical protein